MSPKQYPHTDGHVDWLIRSLDNLVEAMASTKEVVQPELTDLTIARLLIAATRAAGACAAYLDNNRPDPGLFRAAQGQPSQEVPPARAGEGLGSTPGL